MTDTPTFESASKAYEALAKGFYIEAEEDGDPFPMLSDHHREGVIVVVHSQKSKAESLAVQLSEAYGQQGKVRAITSLWDTLTHFARRGIAGIMLDGKHPVHFMNRLSDVNRSLPTVCKLGLFFTSDAIGPTEFEDLLYFGVRGPIKIEEASLVPWHNFRAIDAMSVRWMLGKSPLPESILPFTIAPKIIDSSDASDHFAKHPVVFSDGATLLGPYVSDMGAIPVFSAKEWADFFGACHGILEYQGDDFVPTSDLLVVPIKYDFESFLESIYSAHGPCVDIGLNPTCHRFRQGYFFKSGENWYLRSLSGVFRIAKGQFERCDDVTLPKKDDDVGGRSGDYELVEGMRTLVQHPFKRLLGASQTAIPEAEAQEIVDEQLDAELEEGDEPSDLSAITPDSFLLEGFDKISGDNLSLPVTEDDLDGPLVFADIIEASCWLVHNFLEFDEQIRTEGAKTCHGPYFPGSDDPEAEAARSAAFKKAIRDCLVDALTKGYRPVHSWHLKRLFQDVSAVLELTRFGYVADLLTSDDELIKAIEVAEKSENDEPSLFKRLAKIKARMNQKPTFDAAIVTDLRRYLGQTIDLLSTDSIQVLSAAMEELKRVGKSPAYDYAGVTMKLCKAFERELKHQLFDAWCQEVRSKIGERGVKQLRIDSESYGNDRTGDTALDLLAKKRKPELGGMRFMLRAVANGSEHPAIKVLKSFLESFEGHDWLISTDHDQALERISSRYRNGGVHEHLVNHDLCSEATDYILSGKDAVLPKLLRSLVKRR